jgi:hypothetical protein
MYPNGYPEFSMEFSRLDDDVFPGGSPARRRPAAGAPVPGRGCRSLLRVILEALFTITFPVR